MLRIFSGRHIFPDVLCASGWVLCAWCMPEVLRGTFWCCSHFFVDKIKVQRGEVTCRRSPSWKQAGSLAQRQPCRLEPTDQQFKPLISMLSHRPLRILAVSLGSPVEACHWESQGMNTFLLGSSPLLLGLRRFCWALRDPLCSGRVYSSPEGKKTALSCCPCELGNRPSARLPLAPNSGVQD